MPITTELISGGGDMSGEVTIATDDVMIGPVNETAPATDTASSGLNGRLQRVAQRLTTIIAAIGAAADAAWTAGDGSHTALLKAIAAQAISTNPAQVYQSNSYSNLLANATTVVKSGAGSLIGITINTKGAAANVLTIYDNTAASGTKIATVDTVNGVIGHIAYNVAFSTGLTVVMGTGTAADITVVYR